MELLKEFFEKLDFEKKKKQTKKKYVRLPRRRIVRVPQDPRVEKRANEKELITVWVSEKTNLVLARGNGFSRISANDL